MLLLISVRSPASGTCETTRRAKQPRSPWSSRITLADYLAVLKRRSLIISAVTLLGVLTAGLALLSATKIYESTATLRVATGIGGTDVLRAEDLSFSDRLMNTYKQLVESRPLRREIARRTGQTDLPDVHVDLPANTELLELTVDAPDARLAQRQADTAAQLVVTRARELAERGAESTDQIFRARLTKLQGEANDARRRLAGLETSGAPADERQALKDEIALKEDSRRSLLSQSTNAQSGAISRASTVSVGQQAALPSSPARPRSGLTLALGLFLGLIGGVGLGFLREGLDRRVYSRNEIGELTAAPVLASIPIRLGPRQWSGVFNNASPQQDSFARLRTNLAALNPGFKTLMVTSPEPGAGKSTVTANLAAALARDGTKVIAVDADLRLPTLHSIFQLSNDEGLSTFLSSNERSDARELINPTGTPNLFVMTSGPEVSDPAERLASHEMSAVIAELRERYDFVIVDSPALLSVSDGANLVSLVETVLLVAREGRSTRQGILDAREQLEAVNVGAMGVVVNWSRETPTAYYAAYQRGRPQLQTPPPQTGSRN